MVDAIASNHINGRKRPSTLTCGPCGRTAWDHLATALRAIGETVDAIASNCTCDLPPLVNIPSRGRAKDRGRRGGGRQRLQQPHGPGGPLRVSSFMHTQENGLLYIIMIACVCMQICGGRHPLPPGGGGGSASRGSARKGSAGPGSWAQRVRRAHEDARASRQQGQYWAAQGPARGVGGCRAPAARDTASCNAQTACGFRPCRPALPTQPGHHAQAQAHLLPTAQRPYVGLHGARQPAKALNPKTPPT